MLRKLMIRAYSLVQPCPTRGPVDGFVQPSYGFRCCKVS